VTAPSAVKPTSVIPPQVGTPATWVPVLHTVAAAVLGLLAVVWPGRPPVWLAPGLVLLAVIVFVVGIALYLEHRDRWSKVASEGIGSWFITEAWPTIENEFSAVRNALPPDLSKRLGSLETLIGDIGGRVPALEVAFRNLGSLIAPLGSVAPVLTAQPPQAPATAPQTGLSTGNPSPAVPTAQSGVGGLLA
jgi:hypothetical protein